MCDQDHFAEMGRTAKPAGMSRREFAALGAVATAAVALAPLDGAAAQGHPSETNVQFDAPDGRMDAFFLHPGEGKHPAVVASLDMQDSVGTARGIGVQGYCMSWPFAAWTAAAVPERVKPAASFHGGGLVGEEETAPVKLLGQTQASYLFAIARNDDQCAPGDKDALKTAATAAGRPAEIKVYRADHGWTVADSPVYNYDEDDASWERLLALYSTAL